MPDASLLKIFICYAPRDRQVVYDLYRRLCAETWLDLWIDEESLLPGQDWNLETEKAIEAAHAALVCLSSHSVSQEGYIQKELRLALKAADEKPEGAVFLIPLRLEDFPAPHRLKDLHWLDYFPKSRREAAYQRLLASLRLRAERLGIHAPAGGLSDEPAVSGKPASGKVRFSKVTASGGVQVGRDVQNATILTGDHNVIIQGGLSEELARKLAGDKQPGDK